MNMTTNTVRFFLSFYGPNYCYAKKVIRKKYLNHFKYERR